MIFFYRYNCLIFELSKPNWRLNLKTTCCEVRKKTCYEENNLLFPEDRFEKMSLYEFGKIFLEVIIKIVKIIILNF